MVVYIMLEIFRAGPPYKLAGLQPNCNFNFFLGFLGRATPTCDDFFYRAGQRELVAPVP